MSTPAPPAPASAPTSATPASHPGVPVRDRTGLVVTLAVLFAILAGVTGYLIGHHGEEAADPNLHTRATPSLLLATRDMSRLQTTEMHVEKVIDLTDAQSSFFGLVDGTDNVLLVAVGDVTMGVDLAKLADGDVTYDDKTHAARFRVPAPEVFSSRLDERATYVYSRQTSMFAKRNEQLETRARQQAQDAIKNTADTPEATDRSKQQAEKVLRQLATSLGATSVTFEWK